MRQITGLAIAALTLLGACETATPYQPASAQTDRGYTDQKIESDRWAVRFAGNSLTDRQTVETFLLFRAAELTLGEGFDHFQVVTRQTDEESLVFSDGFSSPFFYDFRGFGPHSGFGVTSIHDPRFYGLNRSSVFYDPFFGSPSTFREQVRFEATAEILMGKGEAPDDAAYFNAREVFENLRPAVVLSQSQ